MTSPTVTQPQRRLTRRRDLWWLEPLITLIVFSAFGIYAIVVMVLNQNYQWGPYLSPFYSPFLPAKWWPFAPAWFVAWVPLLFRLSCYYYRREYYRAFTWDPPACAVRELRQRYSGERKFPLILNNLHRYLWYLTVIVVVFLWIDAVRGFFWTDGFHVGGGSLLMLADVVLLSFYTFSCHAWRHLAGGCLDCMSCHPVRHGLWAWISQENVRHGLWAWCSMFSVGLTDLYIRLVASGVIVDPRIF